MKKAARRWALALLLALHLGLTASGQTPPKQEQPAVRVTTRLVQVNVVVQDKKGQPVGNLTRDDFALLEQGKPQRIDVFSVERSRPPEKPPESLPANTFSNRQEQHSSIPVSVTVILLDGLNTRFHDQAYARQHIIKFLGQLQAQDRVALYTLTSRLRIVHDFTSEAAPLLRALERMRGSVSAELTASEPERPGTGDLGLDNFLRESSLTTAEFFTANRARRSLRAIEAIANHLAGFPGRKNLVWVSGGFPLRIDFDRLVYLAPTSPVSGARIFMPELDRTIRAVNNANLAIYPVDARGLIGPLSLDPAGRVQFVTMGEIYAPIGTMQELAERTGGRAFYNTNDIQGAIRRALDDARVTYLLGYYPTHDRWDGRFLKLKVEVKVPGLEVRHRRGYFALPTSALDRKGRNALVQAAMWSPLDATGIGLVVRASAFRAAGRETVKLEMRIDPRTVVLEEREGRRVGKLELMFVQRSTEGETFAASVMSWNIDVPVQNYQYMLEEGMTLTHYVDKKAKTHMIRVVVRDTATGRMGSVNIPLEGILPDNPS